MAAGGPRVVAAFFVLACLLTWTLYLGSAVGPAGTETALRIASAFGPSVAAFVVVGAVSGGAGAAALLRLGRRWRVHWGWYVLCLAGPPLCFVTAIGLYVLGGGSWGGTEHDPERWWLIPVLFSVVLVLGGPLGEEFGWRGLATPRLQETVAPWVAALVVGLAWGVWHLPRLLDPSSVQSQLPWLLFLLQTTVSGVVYAYLFNRTRSLVPVLLFHASFNTAAGLLPVLPASAGSPAPAWLALGLGVVVAAALVLVTGGRLGVEPQRSGRAEIGHRR